eukprot:CAMPEP_0183403808 /NCGR_PEP_ID=MMETSP0370-20130417/14821_1 /TAXON_ID=268820 /ORGANISM="Peridinium aciculiferum, Strain PAER-2" /LENGTH=30 /DNA_ID= /DNA_START= /DNA_END= /DNA_ORIENTATION=
MSDTRSPVTNSAAITPMVASMAKRPLFSSL